MKVFLSYASKERALAERVCRVLEAEGHDVFFDRDDLGGGDAFGERIRTAIRHARVLVYLISRASVTPPSYALTELSVATALERRSRPAILPVRIDATPVEAIPAALRAYTILEPQGDVPAEIASAVERLGRRGRHHEVAIAAVAGIVLTLGILAYTLGHRAPSTPDRSPAPVTPGGSVHAAAESGHAPDPTSSIDPPPRAAERDSPARAAAAAVPDAVDAFNDAVRKRTPPDRLVTLIAQPGNDGWSATLVLADPSVTSVHYRLDGDTEFTDTGSTDIPNPLSGQLRPNTFIQLPGAFWTPRRIDVKYTDAKGQEHGPFAVQFDPRAQLLRFTKQALGTVAWVSFTTTAPQKTVAYFTTLLSFKAALREIRYSVDSDTLGSVWPLESSPGEGWPARVDHDKLSIDLPPSASRLTVRVTFTDGSALTRTFVAPPSSP